MTLQFRRYRILLIYAAAAFPFIIQGAVSALQANSNSPIDWVPSDFPPRSTYDQFSQDFGSGDLIVASWEGCEVDNPGLAQLTRLLRQANAFHDSHHNSYFERITTGQELLKQLTTEPASLPREIALERLRGTIIGPDNRTTCVVLALTRAGLTDRQDIVRKVRKAIERTCQVDDSELHLAGPVVDGLSVDEASQQALDRYSIPSALLVLGVSALCLKSITGALLVFLLALFGQASTLALVHYCGDSMSALLIVLPPLIQVLSVASGLHLVNYFFDAAKDPAVSNPGEQALRLGWLPTVLSSGTTVVGLISLMVSELQPIRAFGGYAAAGVTLSTATLLIFLPGTLTLFPNLLKTRIRTTSLRNPAPELSETFWDTFQRWGSLSYPVTIAVIVAAMAIAGLGLPHLQTSVRIETLFSAESRVIRDYRWIEEHVGPLVPIEIVLHVDAESHLSRSERLELVDHVQESLLQMPEIEGAISAATILPATASAGAENLPPTLRQVLREKRLNALTPVFEDLHFLKTDGHEEFWRITAQVPAISDLDYARFLEAVRQQIEPELQAVNGDSKTPVTATYTGIMPLVHEIQQQLLQDLLTSFLGALIVITAVMIVVQAGVITGLIAMVSNAFPIVLVFGLLGWSGLAVDIGAVMTASIALGVAVDDTLHFLTFFRESLARGQTVDEAIGSSYRHCGNAMIQSSLVNSLGLLVYALSDFVPTSRFALLMAALLLLALVGDLVLLPALLWSPLGRFFVKQIRESTSLYADSVNNAASMASPGPKANAT
ncbi:MMPL family transporter [bacterium]|nr:MMPL family transporter [bacterium]